MKSKKLCNLVDIIDNNMDCVVLKVKDDAKLDLIKLGYFSGNEDIIRLTKGKNHTCSVFNKDGTNFSWYWGSSGCTLVSDMLSKKGKLIEECITEDFDIYIGDNLDNLKKSLFIKSLDDVNDAQHFIKFMYWDKTNASICVHKDNTFYKHFQNLKEAQNHFKELGYKLDYNNKYIASTGCIVEEYHIEKKKDLEYDTVTNLNELDDEHYYTVARIIDNDRCVELHYNNGIAIVEYGTKISDDEWENEVEDASWFNKSMSEEEMYEHLEKLLQKFNEEEYSREDNYEL